MMGVSKKQMGEETVSFSVMVIMEGCTIALTILAKTAMAGGGTGISPFVFVVYTNAISTLFLLPSSFFFHTQRTEQSLLSLPIFMRLFFLGLTGIALSQNLAFVGLSYSSPIVVCAMGLLIPSFSFLLRIRKQDWSSSSVQFQAIGTLITIMGAVVIVFFKGPFVHNASSSTLKLHPKQQLLVFYSTQDHWVLGGLLLAASSFCVSIWNLIQMETVKHYPQVTRIASFYSLVGTIQCAIFSFIVERDSDAWKLNLSLDLLLIIVTAIFGSVIRGNVQMLFTRTRGRYYVPLFQPFRVFWAIFFGVVFFANSLHYGSIIGTVICGMGYYTIMWGQTRETETFKPHDVQTAHASDEKKVPLLRDQPAQP